MAKASRALPSFDEIWSRVSDYARMCRDTGVKLYTLQRFVPNTIVDVHESSIERHSEAGRTQTAHIGRSDVERVWAQLRDNEDHAASTKGDPRVFTHALMLTAMPDLIEPRGTGVIGLVGLGPARFEPFVDFVEDVDYGSRAAGEARVGRGGGGGEGPIHRGLRIYIHENPNAALIGLTGGPWTSYATEYELATRDRIDVVVRDAEGRFVLIEVKPKLNTDEEYERAKKNDDSEQARAPFAQAAKYREQWQVLRDTATRHLRCVVAAPAIPAKLAETMAERHRIESVAVTLPATGPHALRY